VIGSARSQAELDRVTEDARSVASVKRVVSYVEIRPGEPVAAQPVTPAQASAPRAQAPDAPAAAPATAVEVQKL
jgi:hypothetical protein